METAFSGLMIYISSWLSVLFCFSRKRITPNKPTVSYTPHCFQHMLVELASNGLALGTDISLAQLI